MNRPRCECCDEVMEELLMMRQNFEQLFHRLTTQIVELRRDLRANNKTDKEFAVAGVDKDFAVASSSQLRHTSRRRAASRSRSSADRDVSPPPRKTTRPASTATEVAPWSHGSFEDSNDSADNSQAGSLLIANVKSEQSIQSHTHKKQAGKLSVLEFFSIQAHIMPMHPFNTTREFEAWDALLMTDEDRRDRLRVELLQGHFVDADKYIKHTWRNVLADSVAECYSYRGNVKTNKKAMRDHNFARLLQECFLERYEHLGASYFMERTMRFFNYAHDRKRKFVRSSQPQKFESMQIEMSNMDEEQALEGSNFEIVLPE